jgi:hypothetical protein
MTESSSAVEYCGLLSIPWIYRALFLLVNLPSSARSGIDFRAPKQCWALALSPEKPANVSLSESRQCALMAPSGARSAYRFGSKSAIWSSSGNDRSWRDSDLPKDTQDFRLSGRCRRDMLAASSSHRDPLRTSTTGRHNAYFTMSTGHWARCMMRSARLPTNRSYNAE